MRRNVSLEEISDGKLYGVQDMVKVGCNDCRGCSACCRGMGESVILDPLDCFRLTTGLKQSFEQLLNDKLELNVVDGIILPNLRMEGKEECCAFLNEEGRCSIHALRPGICRLFPLGRYYEDGDFRYFLQKDECKHRNPSKVKVGKWIDTPNLSRNHKFVNDWHYFLKDMEELLYNSQDDALTKNLNLYLLRQFYLLPYEGERDFYEQFEVRLAQAKEQIRFSEN